MGETMKLRQLTPLLSTHNRFQSHWNGSGTVKPVSSFKSVSPQLKPLIDRKIKTYIAKFHSFTLFSLQSSLRRSRAFAAGQTLYGLMDNRLASAVVINPSSEGMTDHSTGRLDTAGHAQVKGIRQAIWRLSIDLNR